MKRIFAFGVCLLLCAALLCGCDNTTDEEMSVDLNVMMHTLDDFKNGDVHCFVTMEKAKKPTETGAESVEEEKPVTYVFDGQEAVDLYNLMHRADWISAKDAATPTGTYTGMVTLDFYAGRSSEKATAYYGSFSISNMEDAVISASPSSLSMSLAVAKAGTYAGILDYIKEKGENEQ